MKHHKRLVEYDEKLTPEAARLDEYLYYYRDCIREKRKLEKRRDEIREEFTVMKSPKLDGLPHGTSVGEPPAVSLAYRIDEIDRKISDQMNKALKALDDIIEIINMLPNNTHEESLSRSILESKYIDRMDNGAIAKEINYSKNTVIRYWKKGLYTLLEYKKVQADLAQHFEGKAV